MKKQSIFLVVFIALALGSFAGYFLFSWSARVETEKKGKKVFNVALFTKPTAYHENAERGFMEEVARESEHHFEVRTYICEGANHILAKKMMEEAVQEKPDIICTIGSMISQVAHAVTNKRKNPIPVVFIGATRPEKLGIVQSLESSGNNVTGVNMNNINDNLAVHVFTLLKPDAKHVLLPYSPLASGGDVEEEALYVKSALEKRGASVTLIPIYNLPEALDRLRPLAPTADTIMYLVGCSVDSAREGLIKLCEQYGITLFAADPSAVRSGAACGFGPDSQLVGQRGFHVMRKVLVDGIRPTDMPVEFLEKGRRIAVNLTAAKKQNLRIPEDVLLCLSRGVVYE